MKIVCWQTILMKYHALFVIFEKSGKILNCHLLQIRGGALRVKRWIQTVWHSDDYREIIFKFKKNQQTTK